jgi:2-polyprenyl-3-methyl-5-hydroxy-6-metoxy-1,4-benzoquinol methylase
MSSEPQDPDVSVDALLQQVRQEVERRRLEARMRESGPPTDPDDQVAASWRAMNEAIAAAEPATTVGMRLPPMTQMRGLRRRIAVPVARLILRVAELVTRDQSAFNHLILELVRMLTDTVHDRLTTAAGRIERLTDGVAQAIAQSRPVGELVDAGARTSAEMRALRERIGAVEDAAARLEVAVQDATTARLRALAERLDAAERQRLHVQTQLTLQERHLAEVLTAARARPSESPAALVAAAGDTLAHLSDAFYVGFEDRFRGTREAVKERARVYLDIVTEAGAGTAERPVLDVGCGRGEWLELLAEHGLVGRGIDLNQAMVLESRARGFAAEEAEALAHLRSLPDGSLGAVTAMHVIEHVEFTTLVAIFEECVRVLGPGGVAIFETPNPRNLLVGACTFYVDPTHRTPLHPDTMVFVAEYRGLTRVRILPLHPVEDGRRLPEDDSPIAKLLNEYLFGPQDYAVVGYRAP